MKIEQNKDLSKYTTFRLGFRGRYFCEVVSTEELKECLEFCKKENLKYFILGGGSNVIADDEEYDGIVIRIKNEELRIKNNIVECGAGVSLAKIVNESLKNNLLGLEWAWGIPGTVGGAVRGNAGAYNFDISESVNELTVFRRGKLVKIKNKDCKFKYRESIFKNNKDIIWSVKLKLKKGSKKELEEAQNFVFKIKKERSKKFLGGGNAGSFFKNIYFTKKGISEFQKRFSYLPENFLKTKIIPAAWLIDQCDLKGFCIGDICVSERHAGIILNKGRGNSEELIQLVSLIKTKVRDKFGIELKEEIQYIN